MMYEWLDITAAVTTAAFVNGVWIGALLAVATWGLIRLMAEWRPLNATTRFFVWMTVFVMSIGLVIWQGERYVDDRYTASIDVVAPPLAPAHEVEIPEVPSMPMVLDVPVQPEVPLLQAVPPAPPVLEEDALKSEKPAVLEEENLVEENAVVTSGLLPGTTRFSLPERIEMPVLSSFWRVVLFTVWATIAGMLLLRVVLGWRGVWHLKKNSYPAPVRVQTLLQKLLGQIENPRPIQVAISDEVQTAVAIGFQQPKILLPAAMLSTLSQGELEQVLLHEAAHLQRRDDWTMLFQRIVSALLFFHPGIILLSKLMDRDREFASDDWVIALTKRPRAYASCLAKLVTQYARTQPPMFVPGFSSGKEELFERVKTILDKKREISFKLSHTTYLSVLIVTLMLLVFAVQIAPVVALPQQAVQIAASSSPATPVVDVVPEDSGTPEEMLTVQAGTASELDALALRESSERGQTELDRPVLALLPITEAENIQAENIQAENNTGTESESNYAAQLEGVSAFSYGAGYDGEANAIALPQPAASQPVVSQPNRVQPATINNEAPARTRKDSLSARSFARVLMNASRIPSSGDKTSLLLEAVQKRTFEHTTTTAYLSTTSSVASSGDQARLLMALTKHQKIDSLSAILYLKAASKIASSSDKSRVLISSLNSNSLPMSLEATRNAYIRAIESISSSSDYRKVMKVFLEKTRRVNG